ncbi:MAG: hypothetical protein ACYDHH_00610, partial [Solirubrobacteraceae bacterium]
PPAPNGAPSGKNVVDVYVASGIPADTAITLTISEVSNPPTAGGSGNLSVSTSSDTQAVTTPFSITPPTSVSGLSVSSSDTAAESSNVVYSMSFTVSGALNGPPSSGKAGYVQLTAPTGTTFNSNFFGGQYYFTLGSTTAQASTVTVNPTAPGGNTGLGNNVVDVTVPFQVPAGSTLKLVVSGGRNPASPNSNGMFSVSTSSDVTVVSTAFPITPPTSVSGLSASASTSAAGASDVVYTTSFTVSSALNGPTSSGQAGYVQLTAPTGTAFDSNFFGGQYYFTVAGVTSQASSVTLAPPAPNGAPSGKNVVDVYVASGIPADTAITLTISEVSNPPTAASTASLSVSTSSDTQTVTTPLPISAPTAVLKLAATPSTASAGASDVVYSLAFNVLGEINGSPDRGQAGHIALVALPGTVFSADSNQYQLTLGTTTLAARSVTVSPTAPGGNTGLGENVVDVSLPFAVPAGARLGLTISAVSNPSAPNGGAQLSVTTSSDSSPVGVPFAIAAASSVNSLVATMNKTTVGASGVDYRATFRLANPLNGSPNPGQAGYVRLTGPPGSVFSSDSSKYQVTDGLRSLPASNVVVNPIPPGDQLGLGMNVVDVYVPFAIPAGHTVQVDSDATNSKDPNQPRGFSAATSSDVTPINTTLGLQATLNVTVGLTPRGGPVGVREPKSKKFIVLPRGEIVGIGSRVDATSGVAALLSAFDAGGASTTTNFNGSLFDVSQETVPVPRHKHKVLTVATLVGFHAVECANAGHRHHPHPVGLYTGVNGPDHSQTVGRYGSAAGNGTSWFTEDTCAGTFFKVFSGPITVNDFPHHRTRIVTAGHSFLAHPGPGG